MQYMDRTFVKSFNKTPVYTHGMDIWRDEIVHYHDVGGRLLEIFLEQVAAERSGDIIDRSTLSEVTKMMLELGKPVYVQDLQEPFLEKSKEFFLCASISSLPLRTDHVLFSIDLEHVS